MLHSDVPDRGQALLLRQPVQPFQASRSSRFSTLPIALRSNSSTSRSSAKRWVLHSRAWLHSRKSQAEISCLSRAVHDARPSAIYTVSVDEKPGVQAIGLTAPDLPPVPGKAPTVVRDYEYVRHGTVSILAGIDLHSRHIFAIVEDRHRSVEFIALLKRLDEYYPREAIIRVVLDYHSAHISEETLAYLGSRPGRFEYVHTLKHGSWLNLIECAFSKMARTFLRPHPG